MTYTQHGDHVMLEMTRADYENLLVMIGTAAGTASGQHDDGRFWRCIRFANEMNRTNPGFTPYEIPAEFAQGGAN